MEQPLSRIGLAKHDGGEMIFIDADASTGIADFRFQSPARRAICGFLLHQGPSIPYNLRPGAKTHW